MRILAIQPFLMGYTVNPNAGGKNKVALYLSRALSADGHEVYVLPWTGEKILNRSKLRLSDYGEYATVMPTGYLPTLKEIQGILNGRGKVGPSIDESSDLFDDQINELVFSKTIALRKAMEYIQPDIIQVHQTHSDFAKVYRQFDYKAPIILTHHSPGLSDSIPLYDHVVFVSESQFNQYQKEKGNQNVSCNVIQNFASSEYYVQFKPEETKEIIFLGQIIHRKGLNTLLQAFIEDKNLNDYRLTVIGNGFLKKEAETLVQKHKLNIRFVGRVSHKENAQLMSKASLFVMPSEAEGLALVYLEALCMGLPIIGYPANIEELERLLDLKVGFSFDPNATSASSLAALIRKSLGPNSEFSLQHRFRIQERARRLFTYQRFVADYNSLYQNIIKYN